MNKLRFLLVFVTLLCSVQSSAQTYYIVIKGGHVIDPKNNINEVMDVAVKDGIIAMVAKNIDPKEAIHIVDARGLYVTPGLIDIHSHNFPGIRTADPFPDGFTFRNGVTTTIDAGSSGWRSFSDFKKEIIDKSETRVLAWLNIVGEGYKGNVYEQNTFDMDPKLTAMVARQNRKHIVGIKTSHFLGHDWTAVDRAVEAGKLAGDIPLMVDFGSGKPPLSLEELFFKHLRPGDIYTHTFGGDAMAGTPANPGGREAIIDLNGKLKPFVVMAQKKGIIFDVGFGAASFAFAYAIPAIKSGFYPNSISTDMNRHSFNGAMQGLLNVMSVFIALGMDLPDVIEASTWNPAKEIKREELGSLSVGSEADIAVLNLREGKFGFYDKDGYKLDGSKRLECELTLRAGKIVHDFNGITNPIVIPTYSFY